MSDIRTALTRKFGPLPAWAWLTIFGAAVYFYRTRMSGGGSGRTLATETKPDIQPTDPVTPQSPVTLQPGESVYDPNTGQLIGTAPEQQPGAYPEVTAPLGEAPSFNMDPDPGPAAEPGKAKAAAPATKPLTAFQRAKAAVLTGRVGPTNRQRLRTKGYSDSQIDYHAKRKTALGVPQSKKKPKPKTQHNSTQKPVKNATPNKGKTRNEGTVKHPVVRTKHKPPVAHHPKPSRPRAPAPSAPKPAPARPRPTATTHPVVRQRPEPAHTTPRKPKPKPKKKHR